MKFDIDDDGNVRVDGVAASGYEVVDDITSEPDVTVTQGNIVLVEADPAKGIKADATRPTTVTYGGIHNRIFETATAEDPNVINLEGYAHQDIQRRVIFAHFHVAGYPVTKKVPIAIESSFTKGVFITLPSYFE